MAGVETYGGCCPKCLKGMLQKWESSWNFMFDACPWCGFLYSEGAVESAKEELWRDILEHHNAKDQEQLVKNLKVYTNKEESEYFPSIYNYEKELGTHLIYKLFMQGENIKGQRVVWIENEERLGTLLEYEEGKIKILWDEQKDPNVPYQEYDAIEIGEKIKLA